MVCIKMGPPQPLQAEQSATLMYLESRVREESAAAARAGSVEATLVHALLATRYAERFFHCSGQIAAGAGQSWVAKHRVW